MIMMTSKNFKCIQWNARGLTKSKLEEFKNYLSSTSPEAVCISESYWSDSFNVRFRYYHVLKKNRPNRKGGGVALLIHKSIQFSPLMCISTDTVEAIGATVFSAAGSFDLFSVYIPKGDCIEDDLKVFCVRPNNYIIVGDFNAHHHLWESSCTINKAGKAVADTLQNQPDACLVTPSDLGTRFNPSTVKLSTIDLAIASSRLAMGASSSVGPFMGSDHLPVVTIFNASPIRSPTLTPSWKFDEKKWGLWNSDLSNHLDKKSFTSISDPASASQTLTNEILLVSNKFFRKRTPPSKPKSEPGRPWWSEECSQLVKATRKAFRLWRDSPTSSEKRAEWCKAEAIKKKTIIRAKRAAWVSVLSSLNPSGGQSQLWSFTKSMLGRGSIIPINGSAIMTNNKTIDSPSEKALIFLDLFGSISPTNIPRNAYYSSRIDSAISSRTPHCLNSPITFEEVKRSLTNTKSQAVGIDDIHNNMLANLSPANISNVRHFFNLCLQSSYVPPDWKKAVVIPLLKPGKPASDPASYRPISLTSCLCKTFERILENRLQWYMETRGLHSPAQAGFRKGRSTTDHIVQLEVDIKRGFSAKKSTVAVFLDINKAYDSVWIEGLLYKLSKSGLSGCALGWLRNFLWDRSFCIRIGGHLSDFRSLENGVPQGAAISPLLFNIMLMDFPNPPPSIKNLLFADDITFYTQVKVPIDAEAILNPFIDEVYRWGRKWKFKFAPDKSTAVIFTRSHKPGSDPILLMQGHRIKTAKSVKFLGVVFDYKLLWKEHITTVVNHCTRLKNLFSVIAPARHGPSIKSLILLFKSLVRSKIDYGLIAYGSAAKSNLSKIEVVVRAILRIILGSKSSTPIETIYADTGIEPVLFRKSWLSMKYLVNLGHKPNNSLYATAKNIFSVPVEWPKFSAPCLADSIIDAIKLNISLFSTNRRHAISSHIYPSPSDPSPCETSWFPMNKKAAIANKNSAKILFDSLLSAIPPATITAFTDGSVNPELEVTSCAIFIPEFNIEKSWRLTKGSSIFSAELYGILQTLLTLYDHPNYPSEAIIFCDSISAIKAVVSPSQSTNEAIHKIRETITNLQSSGTKVTLTWIPSHIGIEGNEKADELASKECESPSGNFIANVLSPEKKILLFKPIFTKRVLDHLRKNCQKKCVVLKPHLRITPWHFSSNRKVSISLHRLRTGHHHLNAFRHRIDPEEDPSCRFGCEALENERHCLLVCPALHHHRQKILSYFASANIPVNLDNFLGLNPDLNHKTLFKIRNLLSAFLVKSSLVNFI